MDTEQVDFTKAMKDIRRQFLHSMIKLDRRFFFIWLVYCVIVLALVAVLLSTGSKALAIVNACWFCYGVFMGQRAWKGWQNGRRELIALDTPGIEA
jgi:hypothetical protein